MPNTPTTLVKTYIQGNQSLITEIKQIIARNTNMLDADAQVQQHIEDEIALYAGTNSANMAIDLISNALAWADWTGIVNELRGEGRTTAEHNDNEDEATKEWDGWKNKATWTINLWLGNDEATYNMSRDIVKSASASDAPRAIRDFVLGLSSPYLKANKPHLKLRAALLQHELGMVDWEHVARSFSEE